MNDNELATKVILNYIYIIYLTAVEGTTGCGNHHSEALIKVAFIPTFIGEDSKKSKTR